jgi:hypothetical protein
MAFAHDRGIIRRRHGWMWKPSELNHQGRRASAGIEGRLTPPFATAISAASDRRLPLARGGATFSGCPREPLCWPITELKHSAKSPPA